MCKIQSYIPCPHPLVFAEQFCTFPMYTTFVQDSEPLLTPACFCCIVILYIFNVQHLCASRDQIFSKDHVCKEEYTRIPRQNISLCFLFRQWVLVGKYSRCNPNSIRTVRARDWQITCVSFYTKGGKYLIKQLVKSRWHVYIQPHQ